VARYPKRGIHGMAVDRIGQRIIRGDLAPGTVLDLEAFEREFDVSRTVIREALRVLATHGLVDARPKRGTYVLPRQEWNLLGADLLRWQYEQRPDATFLANLAEVRAIVEPAGARIAAERRTDEDLAVLRDALERLADPDATSEQVVTADLEFHRALLLAGHNELLGRLELVIETGLRARDLLVHSSSNFSDSVPVHRAVFDAVEAADAGAAARAMERLLEQAARDVEDLEADSGEPATGLPVGDVSG
jgi:GntR family galactonate operon transcriptional repressor